MERIERRIRDPNLLLNKKEEREEGGGRVTRNRRTLMHRT